MRYTSPVIKRTSARWPRFRADSQIVRYYYSFGFSCAFSVAHYPSQTVYTISCSQLDDVESRIEIINDSLSGILDLFDDVTKSDEPKIWRRMKT